MRTRSALPVVVNAVRAFFAANETDGSYGAFAVAGNDEDVEAPAPAAPSAGITEPLGDYDVLVTFLTGGVVGVAGITYTTSLDDGVTTSATQALGTATSIEAKAASGVTIEIGAGVIATGVTWRVPTTAPRKKANVFLGWKEYPKQINQGPHGANRVVFIPGDEGGKDGTIIAVQRPGPHAEFYGAPRPICNWMRVITVSVWAADPSRPASDEPQIECVERLLEDVMQGVQLAASGLYTWGAPMWTKPEESHFGREVRIALNLRTRLLDLENSVALPAPAVNRGTNP